MTASRTPQIAAVGALALGVLVAAATVWGLVGDLWRLPIEVVLLGVLVVASWFAVTRTGLRRYMAAVVGLLAIVAVVLIAVAASSLVSILGRVALLLVAVALARYVVAQDAERYRREATPGRAVAPGRHPVLIMNLRSGGGKATRFHLQEHCRQQGIEAIVLQPGDDLVDLAERAVDRGADVLGMAGGDGSQALVASSGPQGATS
jgi:Diacylglycerol kinase catalytic domain